ncbi:MAG: methyltransferase domain-containing protein [candidate division NC10 bacterium]|nr:methyltransferase domain-containing protein [candidate division NC10 bacterium]
MDYEQVQRAYALLSPVYDIVFDRIFHPGRIKAIELLESEPGDLILEVGVGTGLNLPLYPKGLRVVGIDLSEKMLIKAKEKVTELKMRDVALGLMDAANLSFPDNSFDHILATYVISAVPDPLKVLLEMKRVCKRGGHLVIMNHFKCEKALIGAVEESLAPLCASFGFKPNLPLQPLFQEAKLEIEQLHRVNLFKGWRLIRCINRK